MFKHLAWIGVVGGIALAADAPRVEPNAGNWKTWIIPSGRALCIAAPPDAATTKSELDWLRKDVLTAGATSQAAFQIKYWDAGAPAYRWMDMIESRIAANETITAHPHRVLAYLAMAMYDATVAAWDSKYLNELIPAGAEVAIARLGFAGKGDLRTGDWLAQNWTPQGVWFSASLDGNINVWIMPVSQETGRIEGPPRRVTNGPGNDFAPSPDRNGRLVFQHAQSTSGSFLLPLDPNTGKVAGPRKTLRLDLSLEAGWHSMSDDGRWLTYVKHRGRVTQIVIRNVETGEERELTSFPYRSVNATISRDGAYVAYSDNFPTSTGYVVKSSGGIVRKVCDDCMVHGWLADNRSILGVNRTQTTVRVIDVDSGAQRELLRGERLTRPHLSWDDRWLAFRTASRIWIVPFRPGSPPQNTEWTPVLDVAGAYERHCGWSPDGKLLYLLLDRDGFRCLYAQRINSESGKPQGQPFAVQHFHSPRWDYVSTPFSNGIIRSGFVFNVPDTTGGIWLMEP